MGLQENQGVRRMMKMGHVPAPPKELSGAWVEGTGSDWSQRPSRASTAESRRHACLVSGQQQLLEYPAFFLTMGCKVLLPVFC